MKSYLFRLIALAIIYAVCTSATFAQEEKKATSLPVSQASSPSSASQAPAKQTLPGPEMQKLVNALSGTWSFTMEIEPSRRLPNGGTGEGVEVWRASPGGMPLIEENHMKSTDGEADDSAAIWWDGKAQKYKGIWCATFNDEGCTSFDARWEGHQFVNTGEWENAGKRRAWYEVFSFPTLNSFIQTSDVGEPGGELKRVTTIRATRVMEGSMKPMEASSAEAELLATMDERRKASLEGDTEKIASSLADEYLQTDISGYVQDKTAWLNEYFKPLAELIKAGKFRWEVYERKDVQLHVFGDSAIVIGRLELKGSGARPTPQHTWVADPDASFSGTLSFTHVYIKRNDKWLLAALHNAVPLPPANK